MSAAQALSQGPIGPASGPRPSSSGGTTGESGAASFRDALETVSRSGEPAQDRRAASDRAQGKGPSRIDAKQDRDGDRLGGEAEVARAEPATAADLSAMLAALGAGPGVQAEATDVPDAAAFLGASSGSGKADGGFAGLPTDGDEVLDAAQLLALLKAGKVASRDLPADTMTLKVTVTGQETHLALDRAPQEAFAALSGVAGKADDAAPAAGPALSQSADDETARLLRPARDVGAVIEAKSEEGHVRRVAATAAASGQAGSAAPADQGIGGHDGRPADGRGASGGGAQQQGSAVFMALAGAAPQPAMGEVPGADATAEPIGEQIARHVQAEVKTAGLGDASDGVVKVLNLELKPANMGAVTIRLALKDNQIVVHLEAQRSETLHVIERERQALTDALVSAGYSVDGITAAPQGEAGRSLGAAFAGSGHGGATAQQGPSFGQGQGLAGSSGGQGGSAEGSGHPSYRPPPDDKDTGGGGIRRVGEGLYV